MHNNNDRRQRHQHHHHFFFFRSNATSVTNLWDLHFIPSAPHSFVFRTRLRAHRLWRHIRDPIVFSNRVSDVLLCNIYHNCPVFATVARYSKTTSLSSRYE